MLLAFSVLSLATSSIAIPAVLEDVNGIRTINDVSPLYTIFYPIKSRTVKFSVHAGHDAWIALTTEAKPSSVKYEVLLGDNGNTQVKVLRNRNIELVKEQVVALSTEESRSFWIKWVYFKREYINITVGREGEGLHFMEAQDQFVTDINYVALATTGDDDFGTWQLKDIDIKSRKMVDLTETFLYTTTNLDTHTHYGTFYTINDTMFRFFFKARHRASVIFLSETTIYPYYEVQFSDKTLMIIKNDLILNRIEDNFVDGNNYLGYWISIHVTSRNLDIHGHFKTIIMVGRLGSKTPITRYVDIYTPHIRIKYYGLTSNGNRSTDLVRWLLYQ